MATRKICIVGAGIGGLAAALDLSARGLDVTVLEKADAPGGKMREVMVAGARLDAGPTVFTMKWVFDELFRDVGLEFDQHVVCKPVEVLARHAWSERERLDLFVDIDRSTDAIGRFAGLGEARGYREFCARARATYQTLEGPFIRSEQPTPVSLALGAGWQGLGDLWRISPFTTLWKALGDHFRDDRLRQLFARFATYCGSSPFDAPATLMLVAHVEQSGVWLVDGGMQRLAGALAACAAANGATLRYASEVQSVMTAGGRVTGVRLVTGERIEADAVIVNADVSAVATGALGNSVRIGASATPRSARSLSAVTWSMRAECHGFPLIRHSVFFSRDYKSEFNDIFKHRRLPTAPTVYVCAEDRDDSGAAPGNGPERLLCLVNAPPDGDLRPFPLAEIEQCAERAFQLLTRCGLTISRRQDATVTTTPADFERLFPATGGALYGQASHGWTASFTRAAARSRVPGLYLAGGSTHPGPGVPMAALSGRLAARALIQDLTSRPT